MKKVFVVCTLFALFIIVTGTAQAIDYKNDMPAPSYTTWLDGTGTIGIGLMGFRYAPVGTIISEAAIDASWISGGSLVKDYYFGPTGDTIPLGGNTLYSQFTGSYTIQTSDIDRSSDNRIFQALYFTFDATGANLVMPGSSTFGFGRTLWNGPEFWVPTASVPEPATMLLLGLGLVGLAGARRKFKK